MQRPAVWSFCFGVSPTDPIEPQPHPDFVSQNPASPQGRQGASLTINPLPGLAAFDPGVDAFTGNTIYLEGHRQNSANFGDVRQSSLLVRFGQLTPAFVLQILAPLVLIFIGFGIVARERHRGE